MPPRLALAAVLAALPLPAAAALVAAAPATGARTESPVAPSPQDRGFVQAFLRASLAVREAGALAAGRGLDPGVRAYGATLLRRHDAGARELETLAATLPLPPLPEEPDGDQKAMLDRLLQAPSAGFDHLFLSRLLAEQEDLIKVLSIQAATGEQPALRDFARRQLPVLQDLVQRARELATATGIPPLSASP